MTSPDADLQNGQHRITKLWIDGGLTPTTSATVENDPGPALR